MSHSSGSGTAAVQLERLQHCVPCSTTSLSGATLETITYGYLLLQGAKLLSDGSEGLLEVLDNPGLVGGRRQVGLPAA